MPVSKGFKIGLHLRTYLSFPTIQALPFTGFRLPAIPAISKYPHNPLSRFVTQFWDNTVGLACLRSRSDFCQRKLREFARQTLQETG
jgi:hypothetical protein